MAKGNGFKIGGIVVGAFVVLSLVGFYGLSHKVPAGFDGVVYSQASGLEPDVLKTGRHFLYPWETAYDYPTSRETVYLTKSGDEGNTTDQSFNERTSDGKQVNVDAVYSYHFDPSKLSTIYSTYRGQDHTAIENGILRQGIQQTAQEVISKYGIFDTFKQVGQINIDFLAGVQAKFKGTGIIIDSASMKRIEPTDKQTEASIEAQTNAEMALKTKALEKQQAQIDADKARIAAQGTADALYINAEGQAKSNQALQKSINQEYINYMYAQAAQELAKHYSPQVVAGGSGSILNIPSLQPSK